MNKLRTGDEVLVLAGKDKGKKGIVSAMAGTNRVVVEGVNIVKKHQKPNPNKNEPGGITSKTMPIHISNLAIINPDTGKKDKVSIKIKDDGNKVRVFRSSGSEVQAYCEQKIMARFRKQFHENVVPELMTKFGYKSPMQVPRFEKITLNMGLGEGVTDKKLVESAVGDLANIAGQKPIVTKARKAIAGFKLREGMPIGAKVTLRGVRMYEFLDRLNYCCFA